MSIFKTFIFIISMNLNNILANQSFERIFVIEKYHGFSISLSTTAYQICKKTFEEEETCEWESSFVDVKNLEPSTLHVTQKDEWKDPSYISYRFRFTSLKFFNTYETSGLYVTLRDNSIHTLSFTTFSILFQLTQKCSSSHYGKKCIFCQDKDDPSGHYTCKSIGGLQCLYGWIDEKSNCTKPFCSGCENGNCLAPFTCKCNAGYEGDDCSICKKKKTCVNGFCEKGDDCLCYSGWDGENCDKNNTECEKPEKKCSNKGKCIQHKTGNYYCRCTPSFFGTRCELKILGLAPCLNNGKLYNDGNQFRCWCKPMFSGKFCSNWLSLASCNTTDCLCNKYGFLCGTSTKKTTIKPTFDLSSLTNIITPRITISTKNETSYEEGSKQTQITEEPEKDEFHWILILVLVILTLLTTLLMLISYLVKYGYCSIFSFMDDSGTFTSNNYDDDDEFFDSSNNT